MPRYLNKVTLIGNLGADPEIRNFQNGNSVLTFSIATGESWKDGNNEWHEKTTWHRVAVYPDALIELCQKHLRKGSKVYIEGKLENRSWTDGQGTKHYATEIALRPFRSELIRLDPSSSDGADGSRRQQRASAANRDAPDHAMADMDDDIPF